MLEKISIEKKETCFSFAFIFVVVVISVLLGVAFLGGVSGDELISFPISFVAFSTNSRRFRGGRFDRGLGDQVSSG